MSAVAIAGPVCQFSIIKSIFASLPSLVAPGYSRRRVDYTPVRRYQFGARELINAAAMQEIIHFVDSSGSLSCLIIFLLILFESARRLFDLIRIVESRRRLSRLRQPIARRVVAAATHASTRRCTMPSTVHTIAGRTDAWLNWRTQLLRTRTARDTYSPA